MTASRKQPGTPFPRISADGVLGRRPGSEKRLATLALYLLAFPAKRVLNRLEAAAELLGRQAEGLLGVNPEVAGVVREIEEDVAEFRLLRLRAGCMLKLGYFFGQLLEHVFLPRPGEA